VRIALKGGSFLFIGTSAAIMRIDMCCVGLNQDLSSSRFVHSTDTVVTLLHYVSIQSKDILSIQPLLCSYPFLTSLHGISRGLLSIIATLVPFSYLLLPHIGGFGRSCGAYFTLHSLGLLKLGFISEVGRGSPPCTRMRHPSSLWALA